MSPLSSLAFPESLVRRRFHMNRPKQSHATSIPRRGRRLDGHVYRRRRRPGEVLTPRATIQGHCLLSRVLRVGCRRTE